MVRKKKQIRVGGRWVEFESRVKKEAPWITSRELSDRVATHMMQSGVTDRWLRVEKRSRKKGLFRRLLG